MSHTPEELKYTQTHEWVRLESDGSVTVGITDHAQELLGDIVYIELPVIGLETKQGTEIAVLESVKAAADIYNPVSGNIIAVNETLKTQPEYINQAPYDQGWIFRLMPTDTQSIAQLLSAMDYQKLLK